jgi:hypothetical protein
MPTGDHPDVIALREGTALAGPILDDYLLAPTDTEEMA